MGAGRGRLISRLTTPDRGHAAALFMVMGLIIILATELLTPLGFAHGTLYVPLVLLSLFASHVGWLALVVTAALLFTVLGYFLSPPPPPGVANELVLGNRMVSMVAVLIAGGLVLLARTVIQHVRDTEERLRKQYHLVEVAQRFGRLGGWSLDLATEECHWSDEVARIHGVQPGYKTDLDGGLSFYAPEYQDDLRLALELCARKGVPFDKEMQLITASGERIWVRAIGRPVRDSEGNITRIEGAFQSIEQIKSLEAALMASQERFRRFADVLPLIIWTARPDGVLDYSSPYVESFTGLPRHEFLDAPMTWLRNVHPDDHARAQAAWEHSVASGERYHVEFRIGSKDLGYKWFLFQAYPVRDDHNQVQAWFGTATNIHELKQLEQSARELAERLDNTLDAISDGFVTLDPEWRFTYANQQAQELLNMPGKNLIGKTLWDALPRLIGSPYEATFRKAMKLNQPTRFDGYYRATRRWFSIHLHPNPEGLTALFRDNTREHQLLAQLQAAQRLESVGQLTAGVAHDFNNLLTVVQGNVELLREEAPESMQDLLEQISLAAHQGSDLTYRLMAFARMQPLEPRAVAVDQLMAGMNSLLARTLGADIQLEIVTEDDLWHAEVDPTQLESALLNLCLNARDAMPRGGRLSLESRNVTLNADQAESLLELGPGDYVLITVTDTGSGIADDLQDRVLEPFFTTKPKGEGSGLGLAMVYGFIKQSRGHLKLCSEEGVGTTVSLCLPRATEQAPAVLPEPRPAPPMRGGDATVLIVEDDASVRSVARLHLAALGYRTLEACNGMEAMAVLRAQDIDLLFTDVIMPGGMNGRELADTARELIPDLKVLFTSGYSENAISNQGALEPGVHLLSKPYRHEDLARRIRDVLDAPALVD